MTKNLKTLTALLSTAIVLTACGGGGGTEATAPTTEPTSTDTPMTNLVVAASMNWDSGRANTMTLRVVNNATGAPIPDANITVFTLTRTAPNSDVLLDVPMPVAEIDSGTTDATGTVNMTSRIPANEDEVLVVASEGAGFVRQAVKTQNLGSVVELRISR